MRGGFYKHRDVLHCEGVPLTSVAKEFGTPVYVYSRTAIEQCWRRFEQAFQTRPHQICYAVKACSNIAILNVLAELGSGFDIVSGGELERVKRAGGDPGKVVFSGVGKSMQEIELALTSRIKCLHVESKAELDAIEQVAAHLGVRAMLGLRINPEINAQTHPYIATGLSTSKFGVCLDQVPALLQQIVQSNVMQLTGIACHIGSQITQTEPFAEAARCLVAAADEWAGHGVTISHIDFGGGFSSETTAPSPETYVKTLIDAVGDRPWEIVIEPGRAIVGENGALLTRVEYLKPGATQADKNFAVVDAAINDFIRPALYQAQHPVQPVQPGSGPTQVWDIVGPVCESSDFLARGCVLTLAPGDLLAVLSAGAYGFSMSSNYNSRPRAAEVLVHKDASYLIGKRETLQDLTRNESLLT